MYAVVRRYDGVTDPAEAARRYKRRRVARGDLTPGC